MLISEISGHLKKIRPSFKPNKELKDFIRQTIKEERAEAYDKGFQDGHAKERWLKEEVEKQAIKEFMEKVLPKEIKHYNSLTDFMIMYNKGFNKCLEIIKQNAKKFIN